MLIFESIVSLQQYLKKTRENTSKIGFVPTMGALHEGHLALLKQAKQENDLVVCSIYVNPTQFDNQEDLTHYPRTLAADTEKLKYIQCDVLFAPTNIEMYPTPSLVAFSFGHLDKVMEGQYRAGHFSGMATVVAKFFNIVQPDTAYFGQKDLQQYLIVDQLIKSLSFPIQLVRHPIVREADGLAMSSRNRRLSPAQRAKAPKLYEALQLAADWLPKAAIVEVKRRTQEFLLQAEGPKVEYFEIAHGHTLEALTTYQPNTPTALCIAAFLGDVRLIDNLLLH
ncbi:MAG: pantoate--beta-alanine ligase [Thermonemataceae bacterium]